MNQAFKIKLIDCQESDLREIGFDKSYIHKGLDKHRFKTLKICGLNCAQANILKQTALTSGTDCAVHREVITGKVETSDCILSATIAQFQKISEKLKFQPLKLSVLGEQIKDILHQNLPETIIRDLAIDWSKRPYIMGILNVTPDSFSDSGEYNTIEKALKHYKEMIEQGADIIDIGGESTRPYSNKISPEEEIQRVIPVIKEIRKYDKETIISIDTRNAQTAKEAISSGADIINDVSAMEWDNNMLPLIKELKCPVILNHSSAAPDTMQDNTQYTDVVDDIYDYFQKKLDILYENGIEKSQVIIDPGIGFGKTIRQNYEIIKRLQEFKTLDCPILVGHSRKNFLKETILSDIREDLDAATMVVSQKLIENKVNIIRVHNVKEHKMLLNICQSLF